MTESDTKKIAVNYANQIGKGYTKKNSSELCQSGQAAMTKRCISKRQQQIMPMRLGSGYTEQSGSDRRTYGTNDNQ